MKKPLLLLLALTSVITIQAQISITFQHHAYKTGEKHDFYMAKQADEGQSGANVFWDFSSLTPESSFTSYMLDPASTEKGSMIPEANLALKENENIFYFKVSKSGIQQYGMTTPCNVFTFDTQFQKLKFPFSYGEVVKGEFASSSADGQNVPGAKGDYSIEGDAWGTLVLPTGFYKHTLRVKQTRILKYENSNDIKEITYRWYCTSVRYPILVIIKYENDNGTSSLAKVAYYSHKHEDNTKNIQEQEPNAMLTSLKLDVSPNPFFDQVRVNYVLEQRAPMSFELLNGSGSVVSILQSPVTKDAGSYSEQLPITQSLAIGTYYLKVTYGNKVLVKKIVKL